MKMKKPCPKCEHPTAENPACKKCVRIMRTRFMATEYQKTHRQAHRDRNRLRSERKYAEVVKEREDRRASGAHLAVSPLRVKTFRELLFYRGIKQYHLAEAVKVTLSTVSRWVCGTSPTLYHALAVANYLNVDVRELAALFPTTRKRSR